MDEIAGILERSHGVKVSRCLSRGRTAQQKGLDFATRTQNLAGTFRCSRSPGALEAVVLDDVFTTGATMHECDRALLEEGVRSVRGLCIAVDE